MVEPAKPAAPAPKDNKADTPTDAKPKTEAPAKAEPPKPAAKPAATEADRARALLEGKSADKSTDKATPPASASWCRWARSPTWPAPARRA